MATTLSKDERAELERLRAEAANRENRTLSFKVSEKGACSVYGLGRFPVTLYKEQWKKLLGNKDALEEFLKTHDKELKSKD